MFHTGLKTLAAALIIAGPTFLTAGARDIKITIPGRSELTPVQHLNREGVDATRKHEYERAEALFYKAYLYDPSDPFTLNNLGYVSEMQGDLSRAETFYKLASEQGSNATIAMSNTKDLEGQPMMDALSGLKNLPMRVNRMNVEAIQLLAQDRGFEAERLLQQTLALDPASPFTKNNLGVADEAVGDFEDALKFYKEAANSRSTDPVVVTLNRASRGKPVSEVAAQSARALENRMQHMDLGKERAAMLETRGVSEINQNDWSAAKRDFLEAYKLDPESAFALNNLGYVAEMDGDLETAQFYYGKARKAFDAGARVGIATRPAAEGQSLLSVADNSDQSVDGKLAGYSQERRGQTPPTELIPRGGTDSSPTPPLQTPSSPDQPAPVAPPALSQPPQ